LAPPVCGAGLLDRADFERRHLHRRRFGAAAEYESLEARGIHCIAELYDCPAELLNDESYITGALRESVQHGMATLLHHVSHQFHPQGVTALALIAESHVAIHTWPEEGYAAVDVFTCGDQASAERACDHLVRALQSERSAVRKIKRGLESVSDVASAPSAAGAQLAAIAP